MKLRSFKVFFLLATLISFFSTPLLSAIEKSNEITVAVAANFSPTLEKIIKAFKAENKKNSKNKIRACPQSVKDKAKQGKVDACTKGTEGDFSRSFNEVFDRLRTHPNADVNIQIISSASGSIFRQIEQGAPYDIFLSADNFFIKKLVQESLVSPNEHFPYAQGILVLCARNEKINKSLTLDQIKQILEKTSAKIALADSKSAPYGKAAEQFLKNSNTLDKIKEKLISTRDVALVVNYLDTGVVDFGFIPMSLTEKSKTCLQSSIWMIPTENYEPIIQEAGLLKHGKTNDLAKRFYDFLRTEEVKTIIESSFYTAPTLVCEKARASAVYISAKHIHKRRATHSQTKVGAVYLSVSSAL